MARTASGTAVARKLVRDYERGIYTQLETLTRLIQAAAEHPARALATGLSADWLQVIREETSSPPQSPSDVVYISGILGMANFDYDAHFAKMRQTFFDGIWEWHRFLT